MTLLERELGDDGDLLTSGIARAAALGRARARCRGVEAPSRVRRRPDGVVTYNTQAAAGESLALVLTRDQLTIGQCVTIGVGIAEALAAMHAERVAHGGVSADAVFVDGKRTTLTRTMDALTPGRAGASAVGDIHALGELLRFLADDAAAPIVWAWTAPLLGETTGARPTAAHAAAALALCAPQEPIRAPARPVAAAMRAIAIDTVEPWPQDRWWRVERRLLRLSPIAGLAVAAAVTGAALVPAVTAAPVHLSLGTRASIAAASVPLAEAARLRPDAAAEALALERIAALAAADGDQLLRVTLPGSPAARADAALANDLREGAAVFRGLELTAVDARLEREVPGGAIVEVTSQLSGYGVGKSHHAAGTATARLKLALTQRGWLVEQILPPA